MAYSLVSNTMEKGIRLEFLSKFDKLVGSINSMEDGMKRVFVKKQKGWIFF